MSLDAASRDLVDAARRAARLHAGVRGLECAAAGLLGGSVVFAAGVASGAMVAPALSIVASVVAALTAAVAWRERAPRSEDVARRADRTAGLDGALPAVLDRAHVRSRGVEPASSGVEALLAARVRAAVGPGELARAALPRTPLALVAAALGFALVAVALEQRGEPPPSVGVAAGLRSAAEQARATGGRARADALEIAARRVEAVERAAAPGLPAPDPGERARAALELQRLARSLAPEDPARGALERAARALEPQAAARAPGAAPAPGPGSPGTAGAGRGAGLPSRSGAGPDGPTPEPPVGPALANVPGDGRMLGPPVGGESDPQSGGPSSGTAATGGPGRGVLSARWWPSRYDAVVERYLAP